MTTVSEAPKLSALEEGTSLFREAMRRLAASVMLITSRDEQGRPHGMAASSVISVSMEPASMLVAINRSASLHPVVTQSGRFCINILGEHQQHLLVPFSQTALKDQRFKSDDWQQAWASNAEILPWLAEAPAVIDCAVEHSLDYGTHTLFVGRVLSVRCPSEQLGGISTVNPLVWLAGKCASVTTDN